VFVIKQVFQRREYQPAATIEDPKWILDCGANIGCASAYFLSKYPNANIVAVEPEQANFDLLMENLAAYGERAICIRAAVWSRKGQMKVLNTGFRGGQDWSFQVEVCNDTDGGSVPGITIPQITEQFNINEIDILKMDIEGSEKELLRNSPESWLMRTQILAIETHDEETDQLLSEEIGRSGMSCHKRGETYFCKRTG